MPNLKSDTITMLATVLTDSHKFFAKSSGETSKAFNKYSDRLEPYYEHVAGGIKNGIATDELDRYAKETARELLDDYNARKTEISNMGPAAQKKHKLESAMLDMFILFLEQTVNGNNFSQETPPKHQDDKMDLAYYMAFSMLPQLNVPNNDKDWAKLEELANDYPIDEFFNLSNQAQKTKLEYFQKKEDTKHPLSKEEDLEYRELMYQQNAELHHLSKKLFALSNDDKCLPLFGKESHLRGVEGFQNKRGLAPVIEYTAKFMEAAEKEGLKLRNQERIDQMKADADEAGAFYEVRLSRVPEKTMKDVSGQMKKAMSNIGAWRLARLFGKKNSSQYDAMKDAAAKLQAAFEVLRSDKTEKNVDMTRQERIAQIRKIRSLAETAEQTAHAYIMKVTNNKTKTPHTFAGQDRVNGALDMLDLAKKLKTLGLPGNALQGEFAVPPKKNVIRDEENNPQINIIDVKDIPGSNDSSFISENDISSNRAVKHTKKDLEKKGSVLGGSGSGNS